MASTDARPVPQKNVAYRVTFPILDADGDLVTGATGLDSEISKDGGTFADCTNEATEIATSSGMYYLDLTSTEMNADTVAIIVKTTSSGAKTTPIVMYPEEAGDIRVNVTQLVSDSQSATDLKDFADAGYDPATNKVQGVVLADTVTTLTNLPAITANWLTAAGTAADFTTEIQAGLATAAALATAQTDLDNIDAKTTNLPTDPADQSLIIAATNAIVALLGTPAGVSVSADIAAVKAETASILADTAEIGAAGAGLTALATQASVNTIDDFLDTEIAAIKAKTDNLPAAPAAVGDIPTAAQNADAVWDEAIAGHLGAGSTGEALNAAGAAGDPWTTTLPGAYGAGSAGFIIGNNIDAPISAVDTVVDAIKAKTDSLAFTVAGQVDANIQYVNDVEVTGNGQSGSEWGP